MIKFTNYSFKYNNSKSFAIKDINLEVSKNTCLGIMGESGCGKSTLMLKIMRLLDEKGQSSGSISIDDLEIGDLNKKELEELRWKEIAIVFQNTGSVLNPSMTILEQILEVLNRDKSLSKKEKINRIEKLCDEVGYNKVFLEAYPSQISGGMRQKVLIIMALILEPKILLIDEPTTALEEDSREEVIKILKKIRDERKTTMIVSSHDIRVIKELGEKTIIMYQGYIMEEGQMPSLAYHQNHPYSKGLIDSSADVNPFKDLWGIRKSDISIKNGCPFYGRCSQRLEECKSYVPKLGNYNNGSRVACYRNGIIDLLNAKNITKTYELKNKKIKACDNCSIKIRFGEVVSLIGHSGSGKTTLAEIIAGLRIKDNGELAFLSKKFPKKPMAKKDSIQIVFQDPYSSINPYMTVKEVIEEPLTIIGEDVETEKIKDMLMKVALPANDEFMNTLSGNLSGGERQRLAIGRALIMEPALLLADEITASLDPSTKANIMRLLKSLQNSQGFSMLFITHDLNIAKKISDYIYVMEEGKIIKEGNAQLLLG